MEIRQRLVAAAPGSKTLNLRSNRSLHAIYAVI